jgi:hypothetical protein
MCPASASNARLPVSSPPMNSTAVNDAVNPNTIFSARRDAEWPERDVLFAMFIFR